MSEIKHTPTEAEAFGQWVEEYRKGKPYWSTARIEICRDAWMERAKRDAAPDLLEALQTMVKRIEYYSTLKDDERPNIEQWEYTEGSSDMAKARAAIAKARGQS
jgi:hypothetical protein